MGDILADVLSKVDARDAADAGKKKRAKGGVKKEKVKKISKKELQIAETANNTVLPDHYETIWTEEQLIAMVKWLSKQPFVAVDTETLGLNTFRDEIVGISFYAPHKGYYIPLKHHHDIRYKVAEVITAPITIPEAVPAEVTVGIDYVECLDKWLVAYILRPWLEDSTKKFLFHNFKFDGHVFRNWMKIKIDAYFDTAIAQSLLDETVSKALKDLAPRYLHVEADKFSKLFGKTTFDRVPILISRYTGTGNLASYYAIKDTELTYRLYEFQIFHLSKPALARPLALMFDVEMPFVRIVLESEALGVPLDIEYLVNKVAVELHAQVEDLRQQIKGYVGDININSPVQLSPILYNVLKLPKVNKKKPNSTDKATLSRLRREHPVVPLIIEFRAKHKLTTAFADNLPKEVVNGIIHTSFNTTGTKTGRMSCSKPNLQQIPSKVGGLIRNAFVARTGRLLVSIDFSQQELRVLAHVSGDKTMLNIYKSGKDIHSMTATGMWNRTNPDNVITYDQFEFGRGISELFRDSDGHLVEEWFTDVHLTSLVNSGKLGADTLELERAEGLKKWAELGYLFDKTRKSAKTVNFGIIYGMGAPKLADALGISVEEAEQYIQGYFDAYPGVKRWMAAQRVIMNKTFFTETMLGRKRRVHQEIKSGIRWKIEKGWRMGINAIIQGSSADMVKVATIKLQPLLKSIDVQIVLWVHDEIIFDAPENVGMENLKKIADIMCNALHLDCGLKSDIEAGQKWGQRMSEDDVQNMFRTEWEEEIESISVDGTIVVDEEEEEDDSNDD